MMDLGFFENKKVLITGHTGFKGSWMCKTLINAGALVTGYALEPPTIPALFDICQLKTNMKSVSGDVRDLAHLKQVFHEVKPEIVIHMAAQPLVRESYQNPVYTYDVNVMGTVNVLECVRWSDSVRSVLNVTTDKVYRNGERQLGYRENEELNGYDPYSNSKSCSELVTSCYINSFLKESQTAVSTARAGNVIGGGDFSKDRIIPDCLRAAQKGQNIAVRNPFSVRPYRHVLEPVSAYLTIIKAQYEDGNFAGSYNVGPEESDCVTTGELATLFCEKWNNIFQTGITWNSQYDEGPHEAEYLKLDCSKLKTVLAWEPRWNIDIAMDKVIEWAAVYLEGKAVSECMDRQIEEILI